MPIRNQTYRDNTGGGYPEREKNTKVQIRNNASFERNSYNDGGDLLKKALTKPPPLIPSDIHQWTHSKQPRPQGASYNPMQEFGKPRGSLHSNATSMAPRFSRPGTNAVGNPPNRKGSNAVGRYSERKGHNALGQPSEMMGDNALGR